MTNLTATPRLSETMTAHRLPVVLLIIGIFVFATACSSSDNGSGNVKEPGPLPPISELLTSEGLLVAAPETLRDCLTSTFSDAELKANLAQYLERSSTDEPFRQCDPDGTEMLFAAGGAVADALPGASAPFGLASAIFPDTADEILELYQRVEFQGLRDVTGDEMQVVLRFEDTDSRAINIGPEFTGIPDGTSPAVMIGTMLVLAGNGTPLDSRVGGTHGNLTWLNLIPPQLPNRHFLLWASANTKWTFSASADTEADLQKLVEALVVASKSG